MPEKQTRPPSSRRGGRLRFSLVILPLHPRFARPLVQEGGDKAELPPYSCYSGQINQVLMNLLINAMQAIDGEGKIVVCTCTEGEKIVVEIEDTGRGIPQEIAHKVFDLFFTTKKIGEGIGLGLSISYLIVGHHGDTISFRSRVGEGT